MPPLKTLHCFEAAARHKSFSRAADELHVTQSAVSHQVRSLEQWLGTPLFDRMGRQTLPTAKGQVLAGSLGEAFAIMAEACKRAKSSNHAGTLTIAVLPSIATIWLIPRLESFFRAHPDIPVKIIYLIHGHEPEPHGADIAITWGTGTGSGQQTELLPGATVAVGNPALVERIQAFEAMAKAPLLHDSNVTGWQRYMRKAGVRHEAPDEGPVFEDFNLLRAAALSGQGLALCPSALIKDDVQAGRLTYVNPEIMINEELAYWIVEGEHAVPTSRIAAFKEWLLDQARA